MSENRLSLGERADQVRWWWRGLKPRTQAAFTVLIVIGLVGCFSLARNGYEAWRTPGAAVEACQDYVLENVKAPATAEFDPEPLVTEEGDYGYVVDGYVDAQNGFGAMLRSDYTCQVSQIGNEWMLIALGFPDEDEG